MMDLEEHDEGRAVRREMEQRKHGEELQGCRKRACK